MLLTVAKKKSTNTPTAFGRRLREVRDKAGMSQQSLADAVGMGRVAIAKLETSPEANPTLDTIQKLAAALGCDPAELVAG